MQNRIIGIDPGSSICGIVVLDDRRIVHSANIRKDELFSKLTVFIAHRSVSVVIEDLKPYSLRLTPQVIDTAKFIGEAVYRLKIGCSLNVELISRYEVKKWVFDSFKDVVSGDIDKKIAKKCFPVCNIESREIVMVNDKGSLQRKGSFVYVDDKIVMSAMRYLYKIPTPKAGSGYQYGLKDHAWQALGVASCYLSKLATI